MMKMSGWPSSGFMVTVSAILAALVSANAENTDQGSSAPSGIDAGVLEQAQKAFQGGQKCYIWKSTDTATSSFGFALMVGPFQVLARPENDGVAYETCFRFVAVDKDTGEAEVVPIRLTNMAGPEKASAKQAQTFTALVPLTVEGKKYSGKGIFEFFLATPDGDMSPISNTIQLEVDLDIPQAGNRLDGPKISK